MKGFHSLRRRGFYSGLTLVALLSLSPATKAAAQDPEPVQDPPSIRQAPAISGLPAVGSQLTASEGDWRPPKAMPTYQWLRCMAPDPCTAIPDATRLSYTVTQADVGQSLAIRLIVTSGGLESQPAVSARTEVVPAPPVPPAPISGPTISGDTVESGLLTGAVGSWSGTAPLSFAYEWLRCDVHGAACNPVEGASYTTYRLAALDVGHTLRFGVTAANVAGITPTTSAPTAPVVAAEGPPSPSPSPSPAPTPTPSGPLASSALPELTSSIAVTAPTVAPVGSASAPARLLRMTPFPVVRIAGRFSARRTRFTLVTVNAPRGALISLICRGRGCVFRRRAVVSRLVRIRSLQRTFLAGAVIEVRVTATGVIGGYTRITVRRGQSPARVDRCLMPGSSQPISCPSG